MDLTERCNKVFNCFDGSDERNCDLIEIDTDTYRKILPPVSESNKTIIEVTLTIKKIDDIDEILMKFHSEVKVVLHWRDPRITFKNLANGGNFLDKFWQDQIWLPPLFYSNTENNVKILSTDNIVVEVQREGNGKPNPVADLDEGKKYKGDENDIVLSAYHDDFFYCLFDLSEFPFDSQKCDITIKIPKEIKDYITLQPNNLTYTGKI